MQWNLIPGSTLAVGQPLAVGDYIQSPGKTCFLVQQSDGNLCVYAGPDPNHNGGFVWGCNSASRLPGAYYTLLQDDGTLCVYEGLSGQESPLVWSSMTAPPPPAPAYFAQLDDHGELTVHAGTPAAPSTTLWGNFGVNPGARIEHVVVLMLENRGFDTALGFLYTPQDPPAVNVPPLRSGELPFTGLAFEPGVPQTGTVRGATVTRTASRGVAGPNSPGFDPGEEWGHVNTQLWNGKSPGPTPTMDGFLADFGKVIEAETHPLTDTVQVMEALMSSFAPWDLPNLSRLARTYGVSDRWFSSVPTQTNANRAFSLCGQSMGEVDNGYVGGTWKSFGVDTFAGANTIFNTLSAHGMTDWAIYYNELYPPALVTGACYTELAFPQIDQAAHTGARFLPLSTFMSQARAGTLPRFSYLEPAWGGAIANQELHIDGNDYHPPSDVTHSEQMLMQLYQALTSNRAAWAKTLFVIMFDEHGGTYDHVPPGPALPPWGSGKTPTTQHNFGFDRYGVRVPNLFLSPFIAPSTVVRSPTATPFDHTSMLASLLDWCGIPRAAANLGARTQIAPSFWAVLNQPLPRTTDNAFPTIAAPATATPLHWGQRFYLRNQSHGSFITSQVYYDHLGYKGWYPTLAKGSNVAFELRSAAIGNGYQPGTRIDPRGRYQLRSSEYNAVFGRANQPEAYNSLSVNQGHRADAIWLACIDVTADLAPGAWLLHPTPPGLQYGGTLRFESVKYPGYYLASALASQWLYLSSATDQTTLWQLFPAPSGG